MTEKKIALTRKARALLKARREMGLAADDEYLDDDDDWVWLPRTMTWEDFGELPLWNRLWLAVVFPFHLAVHTVGYFALFGGAGALFLLSLYALMWLVIQVVS